ncbi:MAG: AlpA family phage regulatory protein [Deltaproteobacteria bacterium]|nr:AlpA family phage regulatory protein [Deltaproteobacteria bacterium]
MKAKETTESFKDERMTGLLRLPQVLKLVPVSASTWWTGCRDGRFPKPVYLSKRVTAWKASDIQRVIAGENNF